MDAVTLYRVDPARNMRRFYALYPFAEFDPLFGPRLQSIFS
jgi:hypothetical protein